MDEQIISHRLAAKGNEKLKRVLEVVQTMGLEKICYASRGRVKKADDIVSKIKRKITAEKKEHYNCFSVTDVVGFRIVTLFRSDSLKVIPFIIDLIRHQSLAVNNPFLKDSLEQAVIYTPHANGDSLAQEVAHVIREAKFKGLTEGHPEILEKGARYSSIHLVARLETERMPDCPEGYGIPIEIQIRTVFEDAWGEIDHKYKYEVNREGNVDGIDFITNKHLLVLKQFVDACVSYADLIDEHQTGQPASQNTSGNVLPVERDKNEVALLFEETGVPQSLRDDYMHSRFLRDTANEAVRARKEEPDVSFVKPLSAFEVLGDKLQSLKQQNSISDNAYRVANYFIKMGTALCLLSMDNKTAIKDSLSIYQELLRDHQDNVLILFRLGQGWMRSGNHSLAIKFFRDVIKRINQPKDTNAVLTESDVEYIKKTVYKLLGYAYWNQSFALNPESFDYTFQKLGHLLQAFRLTKDGLEFVTESQRIGLLNNMLFYGEEYHSLIDSAGQIAASKRRHIPQDELKSLLKALEAKRDIGVETDVHLLDTLAYTNHRMGNKRRARKIAQRITELLGEDQLKLSEPERKILARANMIIDNQIKDLPYALNLP